MWVSSENSLPNTFVTACWIRFSKHDFMIWILVLQIIIISTQLDINSVRELTAVIRENIFFSHHNRKNYIFSWTNDKYIRWDYSYAFLKERQFLLTQSYSSSLFHRESLKKKTGLIAIILIYYSLKSKNPAQIWKILSGSFKLNATIFVEDAELSVRPKKYFELSISSHAFDRIMLCVLLLQHCIADDQVWMYKVKMRLYCL